MARQKRGAARMSTVPRRNAPSPQKEQSQESNNNNNSTLLSQESVSTEAVLSKLALATEIEKELESIASSLEQKGSATGSRIPPPHRPPTLARETDEKNQALRLQLCGIYSDVILVDCGLSHSNDVVGRLWKYCFYSRIDELRSRIMSGKRSVAKHQATTTSAAIGGGVLDATKKIVTDIEKQLSSFLDESVQLYKYLIERYVRELLPLSQSQSSTVDADDDNDDESDSAKEEQQERLQAVIISLYRMNIHLGDLYRYSTSFKLAEECYLLAAKLSPGTGNPYNQLAVVAQQSPDSMTALALYYYARSLMATNGPFETSRANLERLFDANNRWITEHKRGNQDSAGTIIPMNNDGMTKKGQKEWMHKQRTAANRMALARFVDLQWVFYRGVSLESNYDDNATGDKTALDGLMKEMSSLHETLTNLMVHASFSESLLCKLVVILAFSTLGASSRGKSITADQFDAKRANDPKWHEGIIRSNQALAFSFFLRFCAMLAKDVDAMISKKEAAGSWHKHGTVRSLSSLLLGFRFVTSIYEGCDWFHGLSYFFSITSADDVDYVRKTPKNCAIHKLCTESHTEFWSSIAILANRMDTLPNQSVGTQEETDLADLRDFIDFHGYAPFASFLDKCDTNTISLMRKSRTIKYATVDEAIHALAKTKPIGGNNGGDAATTMVKIKIFLSTANGKTCPTSQIDGNGEQFFLSSVAGSSNRVLATLSTERRKNLSEDQMSPTFRNEVYTVDMGVDDVHEAFMEQSPPKEQPPPKSLLSGIREGLLTPAALLAANADQPHISITVNEEAKELPLSSPLDSLVQWNTSIHSPPVQSKSSAIHLKAPAQAPLFPPSGLIPPPGFSFQPQQGSQVPLAPRAGVSSVESLAPQQYEQNMGRMIPHAGSRFSSSNTLFETLNPFAHQAPHSSFNNDFVGSSFGLNQQPGFDVRLPSEGRLDTTLDFFLRNRMQSTDDLAWLVPTSAGPEDPGDSIFSILFDSNDSSKAGQQFYSSQPQTMQAQNHAMTRTNNPFAT